MNHRADLILRSLCCYFVYFVILRLNKSLHIRFITFIVEIAAITLIQKKTTLKGLHQSTIHAEHCNWGEFPYISIEQHFLELTELLKRTVKIHERDAVWTEYGIAASTNLFLAFCSTTGPMRPVQIKSPSISGRNIDCGAFHVAIVKRDTFPWVEQIQAWCISEDQPWHHSPLIRNKSLINSCHGWLWGNADC